MAFLSTAISSGLGAPFLLNHAALAASATNSSSSEQTGISCGDTASQSNSASGNTDSADKGSHGHSCASGMMAICRDAANPNNQIVVVKGSCTDTPTK